MPYTDKEEIKKMYKSPKLISLSPALNRLNGTIAQFIMLRKRVSMAAPIKIILLELLKSYCFF